MYSRSRSGDNSLSDGVQDELGSDYLSELGVPSGRLKVISYGKERPQCVAQEESCRQKNRRAHITAK